MNVRDLRIGDYLKVPQNNDDLIYEVVALYEGSYVDLRCIEDSNIYVPSIETEYVAGVPITDAWLKSINAEFDKNKMYYILSLSAGDKILIRPQIGDNNYMLSVLGRYKSPFMKVTYIHELQHWVWDLCQHTV